MALPLMWVHTHTHAHTHTYIHTHTHTHRLGHRVPLWFSSFPPPSWLRPLLLQSSPHLLSKEKDEIRQKIQERPQLCCHDNCSTLLPRTHVLIKTLFILQLTCGVNHGSDCLFLHSISHTVMYNNIDSNYQNTARYIYCTHKKMIKAQGRYKIPLFPSLVLRLHFHTHQKGGLHGYETRPFPPASSFCLQLIKMEGDIVKLKICSGHHADLLWSFLHTASDQKLEMGVAWEQD